ncbi:MAG: hypothetical protein WCL06_03070 [Bacteroidota bacterium]
MKKLLFTGVALLLFAVPIMAQVDHDYNPNDVVPTPGPNLSKDQVPASVVKAASIDFDLAKPETWTKFPFALKEYGWVYDKAASDVKPDRYEVTMKASNGDDLYAVYSADGVLIATREVNNNAAVPASVMAALSKSQYKDWKIVGNKETIRYYHDKKSVEQHFRVTVEKDNVKRSISFNYQASANGTAAK